MDVDTEGSFSAETLKSSTRKVGSQTLFLDRSTLSLSDAVLKRSNSFWASEEDYRECV